MKTLSHSAPLFAALALVWLAGCSGASDLNVSTANVKHISQGEFEAEVTRNALPVVADFYAPWCGPCRLLAPMLDKLAAPHTGQIKFVKINVDEAPGLAQNFEIRSIPTLIFFKDGKVVERITGLPPEDELKAKLAAFAAAK